MSLALMFFLPAFGGLLSLLTLESSQRRLLGFVVFTALLASFLNLALGDLPHVALLGSWPHYAGIAWVVDGIGLTFICATLVVYFPCMWALAEYGRHLNLLFHLLTASLIGCFVTGDLFNLYVMFEILLLSTYAMFFVCKTPRSGRLFIWLNVFLSAVFLFGIAFVYKATGTVNFVELSIQLRTLSPGFVDLIFFAFAAVFLAKAALIPLGVWLPSSYPALPPALLAFVASLSTKVGLFSLLRWTEISGIKLLADHGFWLWPLAVLTIFIGIVGAVMSDRMRGALVYFGLSHIGLMFIALMIFSTDSLSALLLYFVHDALSMAGLFFFCGDHERAGRPTGIFKRQAFVGLCFLVFILSAAGVPPSAGFVGKFAMLESAIFSPGLLISILGSAFVFLVFAISRWNREFVGRSSSVKAGSSVIRLSFSTLYCFVVMLLISIFSWISPDFFKAPIEQSRSFYSQSVRTETEEILEYRELRHK